MAKRFRLAVTLTVVILATILTGCGPKATVAGYRQVLDQYRGGHIDKLVADWGPPSGKHVYADGRHEYVFTKEYREDYQDSYITPTIGFGYHGRGHWGIGGAFSPRISGSRYSSCETRVVTDKRNNIVEFFFKGDACRAIPYESQ